MAVPEFIKETTLKIRHAVFGPEITEEVAHGIEEIAVVSEESRTDGKSALSSARKIEEKYKEQLLSQDLNPNKDPELVDIRDGFDTAGERIKKFETDTTAQLERTITLKPSGLSDTNRVQQALDNYDLVKLIVGSYPFNIGSIEFQSNSKIVAIGDVVVNLTQASGGFHAIEKDNIGVYDLKIHGGQIAHATDPENGDTGIYFENCTRVSIKNVKTDNTKAWGIILLNCEIALVDHCEASGSGKQSGIALVGTKTFIVSKNTTYNNKYAGIIIEPNNNHGIVTDNISYLNEIGILAMYSDDILIMGNRTYTNYEVGISAQQSSDITVKLNESYANGDGSNITKGRGFYSIDVSNLVFENNNIYNNNSSGTEIINTTLMIGLSFKGNRVINNCKTDTSVNAHGTMIIKAKDLVYEDNTVYGHKRDLYISADSTIRSFKVSAQSNTDITATSEVPTIPAFKDLDFLEYTLKPSDLTGTFLLPFNAKVYGIVATFKVNNLTGGGYININVNNEQYGRVYPSVINTVCQASLSISNTLDKVFLSGEQIKLTYTHSYNMAYVEFVKVKLLYM